MDEYDQGGVDPQMKKYFRKIVSSFSFGVLWMLVMATVGLYFEMALFNKGLRWYNVLFYMMFLISLLVLLRFFYRTWRG